jgi:hypothetical protein
MGEGNFNASRRRRAAGGRTPVAGRLTARRQLSYEFVRDQRLCRKWHRDSAAVTLCYNFSCRAVEQRRLFIAARIWEVPAHRASPNYAGGEDLVAGCRFYRNRDNPLQFFAAVWLRDGLHFQECGLAR